MAALAPHVSMADVTDIIIDSGNISTSTSAATASFSWLHTVNTSLTNRYMVVCFSLTGNTTSAPTGIQVSSVSYGGNALTRRVSQDSGGTQGRTEIWDLLAPPTGSNTVSVTLSASTQVVASAVAFGNVNQSSPSRSSASTAPPTASSIIALAITSALRDAIIDVVSVTDPITATPGTTQTLRWNFSVGSNATDLRGTGSTKPGVSPFDGVVWSLSAPTFWSISAESIQPPNTPTLAKFVNANALDTSEGTFIRWRTGYEVDNLGFRVWREDQSGERVLVNRSLVAGSALFAGPSTALSVGRSYSLWDTAGGGKANPYWLEAVDLKGQTTWYGPFLSEPVSEADLVRELGGRSPLEAQILSSPPLNKIGRGDSKVQLSFNAYDSTAQSVDRRVGGSHGQWRVASAPAAKILVDHAGFYRVTRTQLADAGYDPGPDAMSLQLFNHGHEKALKISGLEDGRLDMEDFIEFYARDIDTAATGVNVYWLTQGVRPGRRMRVLPEHIWTSSDPVATFPATVVVEDRSLYVAAVTNNGERDNFYGPTVGSDSLSQVLGVDTLPLAGAQQAASLEIALQGVTMVDHRIAITFNGHELEEMEFSGNESSIRTYHIDPSWLRSGANEVLLEAQNGDEDVSVTDYLRLTWQRPFVASGDRLEMTAPANATVRVSGFSEEDIRLFDVTNRHQPVEIQGFVGQDADGSWMIEAVLRQAGGGGDRALFAVTERQIEAPLSLEANKPSTWHARKNSADMVIISHSTLLPSAERLAAHRNAHGVTTVVVDVADLYDEFSMGIKDPEAVRVFLKRAASVWETEPRYVLLMGDSSFDPRNYLGFGYGDLVPTKLLATNFLKTANDDWFADLDGDGLANLAVGRLPARTLEEADSMVAKIIGYEKDAPEGAWIKNLALIVDAVTGDFDFRVAAAALESLIPVDITVDRIDLGEMDRATAHQQILDAFDEGQMLINFDGHGSQTVWVSDSVFGNGDALSLNNGLKLPFVVAMNCLNGLFQDVYQDSLAEALLSNPNGGAVAVWASSALTDPTGQDLMNRDFYLSLFGESHPTIGDSVLAAKANVTDPDIRNTWILFGDPSMQLKR